MQSAKMQKLFTIITALLLPLALVYLEMASRANVGLPVFHDALAGALLTAASFALLVYAICSIFGGKAGKILCLIFTEVFTIWFLVAVFTQDSYKVFMEPAILFSTAGNAAKDFGSNIKNVIFTRFGTILLFHIPVFAEAALYKWMRFPKQKRAQRVMASLLLCLLLFSSGFMCSTFSPELENRYHHEYTYDNAVKNFGVLSALTQNIRQKIYPDSSASDLNFSVPAATPAPTAAPVENAPVEEEVVEYGKNVMELDFTEAQHRAETLTAYIQSLEGTSKNKYTGIFEGKNLILITAEAFSKEVIDPERTPTLYRLANKGIVFEDFYQPAWGGSTSTGEYSWLTGLAPVDAMSMMTTLDQNLYFTMGNQLQRLGYFSRAYHNGSSGYYNRFITHPRMGYEQYIAADNGLNDLSSGFPKSDLEMFDLTLPQYIDNQPFSVYYMTISGHASYAFSSEVNDMSVKNQAVTEGMPYSETVRAYYACNQELELALTSMVSQLEEAGIADDTVIAIVSDHYPYGLEPSAAWGVSRDYLAELYGYKADTNPRRDHNAAIIWSGSLEELDEPIVVSTPTSSLDILPTLSNLFGLEFDSRLLAGRDVFSEAEPLVFWNDYCWLTEKGYYDSHKRSFTPAEGQEADEAYVERINALVKNKKSLSSGIANNNYYTLLFGRYGD